VRLPCGGRLPEFLRESGGIGRHLHRMEERPDITEGWRPTRAWRSCVLGLVLLGALAALWNSELPKGRSPDASQPPSGREGE
jgi:hypothetical protein